MNTSYEKNKNETSLYHRNKCLQTVNPLAEYVFNSSCEVSASFQFCGVSVFASRYDTACFLLKSNLERSRAIWCGAE